MIFLAAASAATLAASIGNAASVTSYDIINASVSGFGGWSNNYSGTITPTGYPYANYTGGGSGTLNDGFIPNTANNDELFYYAVEQPVITAQLDGTYHLSSIDFLSAYDDNYIPGSMTSVDVTIDGVTQTYTPIGFGPMNFRGVNFDQEVVLSPLQSSLAASSFSLTNFQGYAGYVSIGELTVNGEVSTVPEPAAWGLMLVGFGGLGMALRRRRHAPA
jgi:hypothetical protein